MRRDNIADMQQEIRDLTRRLRDLETANPLANASLMSGRIRILTPGGDGQSHTEEAIIGHAYGKKGILVRDGADWVTTKEFTDRQVAKESVVTDGKISASHEYPNARITSLEGFANTYGPTVNTLVSDMAGVDGKISASHAYPNNRIGDLEGRMSSVESGKASVSSLNAVDAVADSALTAAQKAQSDLQIMKNIYNNHIDSAHPGLPKMNS